ncbi:MAG: branched-chain amino acid ABC transporter permease [Proteobacteria bacterium]|nr:branched-chain amino acid ABC transporter permease [Pseudomonadota bacterium]MBU4575579.1 branched-chain amino acid ABC transporter permease [Pseudomonadota bacterium]MBU4597543.1 branched-chain amino acid ABC transporter permease [Pseudomonadota bacterium]
MQVIMGLALGAIYVLLASGLSIIFGLLDVLNFAHGTFYMLGAYAMFTAISLCGNFWVGLVAAVVIVSLIGGLFEITLLKRLYGTDQIYPLLLCFGLGIFIPDIIKMAFGLIGKVVDYPAMLQGATFVGNLILPKYRIFLVVLMALVLLALYVFMKKTSIGMIIRAATRDRLMVNCLGINVSRVWTVGFMLGIGLAALAGAVAAPMVQTIPNMGDEMTVEAFVVVVIGGLGSLGGAALGGLILGQVVSFVSLLAPDWSNVSIFLTMALILVLRPRGLFGEEGRD